MAHFAMRRGLSAEERRQIAFPVPFWPVAPLLTLLFMGLVICGAQDGRRDANCADCRSGLALGC